MADPFTIINPGRKIVLKPEWRKSMGFTHGRIIRLLDPIANAIIRGGTYRVARLDGPADSLDLQHDLHRETFIPVSNTILARGKRRREQQEKNRQKSE